MKIPFLPLHIINEQVLLEKKQTEEKLNAMRSLTSGFIPEIEQLLTVYHEAKVGRAAYGRRKAQRKVFRKVHKLREAIKIA